MYLPSVVLVALMQVGGPDSGERLHAFHEPRPTPRLCTAFAAQSDVHTVSKPQLPQAPNRKLNDIAGKIAVRIDNDFAVDGRGVVGNPVAPGPKRPDTEISELPRTEFSNVSSSKSVRISATQEGYTNARVDVEKQVVLSAGIQGKLMTLRAPLRDRTGHDVPGPDGEPTLVEIKPGQIVRAGEIIGTIDDVVELKRVAAAEATLEVAKAEENKTIEVDFAVAQYQVAYAEVMKNDEVNRKVPGGIPDIIVLESKLKLTQSEKQVEKAKYDLKELRPRERMVKEQELAIAEAMLEQRRLVSPVDGVVQQVIGQEGEWFREGDDILRIIRLDKVLVKADIDATRLAPRHVHGRKVTVTATEVDGTKKHFDGVVVFASEEQKIDVTFEVHVEVENVREGGFWAIRPGQYVDIVIHLDRAAREN